MAEHEVGAGDFRYQCEKARMMAKQGRAYKTAQKTFSTHSSLSTEVDVEVTAMASLPHITMEVLCVCLFDGADMPPPSQRLEERPH